MALDATRRAAWVRWRSTSLAVTVLPEPLSPHTMIFFGLKTGREGRAEAGGGGRGVRGARLQGFGAAGLRSGGVGGALGRAQGYTL